MNQKINAKYQKGFTLLELIFSVGIGMIVLVGVLRLTAFSSLDRQRVAKEASHQESLAIANNRLANLLKQAYTMPCGDLDDMLEQGSVALARDKLGNPSYIESRGGSSSPQDLIAESFSDTEGKHIIKKLYPLEVGTATANQVTINGVKVNNVEPNSDYFVLTEIGEKLALSNNSDSTDKGQIKLSSSPTGKELTSTKNKVFMVTDCNKSAIFQSVRGSGGDENSEATITVPDNHILNAQYGHLTSVASEVKKYIVYIEKGGGLRKRDLLASPNDSSSRHIGEDVFNMKIRWGVGKDGQFSAFFPSSYIKRNASNMISDIVSAEITLTMPTGVEGKTRDYVQVVSFRNRTGK